MAVPVYYTALGLDPWAGDDEIHEAFHRLASQYQAADEGTSILAGRRLRMIEEAYAVLGNPARRAAYDAQLSGARYISRPAIAPEPVAGGPTEEPEPAPAPARPSRTFSGRRLAVWGWLRRHPAHSAGITVLLLLLQFAALEQSHHSAIRPRPPTPTLPGAPAASATLIAALSRLSPSPAVPRRTATARPRIGRSARTPVGATATATPSRSTSRLPATRHLPGSSTLSPRLKTTVRSATATPSPQTKGQGKSSFHPIMKRQSVKPLAQSWMVAELPRFPDRRLDEPIHGPTGAVWHPTLPLSRFIDGRQPHADAKRLWVESLVNGTPDRRRFSRDVSRIQRLPWRPRGRPVGVFGEGDPPLWLADVGRAARA